MTKYNTAIARQEVFQWIPSAHKVTIITMAEKISGFTICWGYWILHIVIDKE